MKTIIEINHALIDQLLMHPNQLARFLLSLNGKAAPVVPVGIRVIEAYHDD
jgi:hypothetical protein